MFNKTVADQNFEEKYPLYKACFYATIFCKSFFLEKAKIKNQNKNKNVLNTFYSFFF
jgi:hypothetical protein